MFSMMEMILTVNGNFVELDAHHAGVNRLKAVLAEKFGLNMTVKRETISGDLSGSDDSDAADSAVISLPRACFADEKHKLNVLLLSNNVRIAISYFDALKLNDEEEMKIRMKPDRARIIAELYEAVAQELKLQIQGGMSWQELGFERFADESERVKTFTRIAGISSPVLSDKISHISQSYGEVGEIETGGRKQPADIIYFMTGSPVDKQGKWLEPAGLVAGLSVGIRESVSDDPQAVKHFVEAASALVDQKRSWVVKVLEFKGYFE